MDVNVRAFRVVQQALTGDSKLTDPKKIAGRKGGLIGGPSRAMSMSAKRRREIAKKASTARWDKRRIAKPPKAKGKNGDSRNS